MWKRSKDWQPEVLTAPMIARNQQLWTALQKASMTDQTELRLDFFYDSAGSAADSELGEFLRQETDYDVKAGESTHYGVTGTTQPTLLNPEKLDQWVTWMVLAGYEHGRCKFDGWGAAIPKAK
jgi:hypothetical protein